MRSKGALSLPIFLTILTACGGSGGGGNNPPTSTDEKDPIKTLSLQDQQRFKTWQDDLTKNCSAKEAFEGKVEQDFDNPGIDFKVLMDAMDHKTALATDKGSFVLIADAEAMSGFGTDKYDRSDSSGTVSAEFKRSGSTCEAWISGKKVYVTKIYPKIMIEGGSPAKKETKLALSASLEPSEKPGLAKLQHSFGAIASEAFASNEDAAAILRGYLKLDKETMQRHFETAQYPSFLETGSFPSLKDVPFFAVSDSIIGSTGDLNTLMNSPQGLKFEIYFQPAKFMLEDEILNSNDTLLVFETTVSTKANAQGIYDYFAKDAKFSREESYNPKLTAACFKQRNAWIEAVQKATNAWPFGVVNNTSPASFALAGCRLLSQDIDDDLYHSKEARSIIVKKFADFTPPESEQSAHLSYGDWNLLLGNFIARHLDKGEKVSTLDPKGTAPLIPKIVANIQRAKQSAAKHKNLKDIEHLIADTAIDWSFQGILVADETLNDLIEAMANIADIAQSYATSLLSSADYTPNSEETAGKIKFALAIDKPYKNAVKDISQKGRELDQSDWADAKIGSLLSDQPSLKQLRLWIEFLDAAAEFKQRDKARTTEDYLFERNSEQLIDRALEEGWTKGDYSLLEKVAGPGRFKTQCQEDLDVSSLTDCIGLESFSKNGFVLDPTFKGRYGKLAGELDKVLPGLEGEGTFLLWDIIGGYYRPIWKACDNEAFGVNQKELLSLIKRWQAADYSDRFTIQDTIRDLLEVCQN
jgi:hypothetical protein